MQIFITGTDTNVGKTLVCSWLCLHTGYSYFKPIQTGSILSTDSHKISKLTGVHIYKENFIYKEPLSPHLAASLENDEININKITVPQAHNLIIEGAGGVLVPINKTTLMVDLIKKSNIPTILVARSTLGTINHTLLSLEALRARNIPVLGVILSGKHNQDNLKAIEFYGRVQVLASIPKLQRINKKSLAAIPLSNHLQTIFKAKFMSLSERDKKIIWHPFTQEKTAGLPIAIKRASGSYLHDEDDKPYLDLISSWWVNLHGHAHPEIAKAIYDQSMNLEHVMFAGFTHEPAVQLCEKLQALLQDKFSKFFFSDNGSTAVEVALKMAYQYWYNQGNPEKTTFLSFAGGYHGDTFGAMSVGARSGFHDAFSNLFFPILAIPFPATWNGDEEIEKKEIHALKVLEDYLCTSAAKIAALILEPLVQGASGMRMCSPKFVEKVVNLVRQHKILVIFDEVMTGFGRTGTYFAFEQTTVVPDFLCISKGLTGGFLPLALTITTEEVYTTFLGDHFSKAFAHGHSYTANPLGCAAAIASLDLLIKPDTLKSIQEISKTHKEELANLLKTCTNIQHTRVTGTIAAFDVTDKSIIQTLKTKCLEQGLLIRPLGNSVYLLPPYSITIDELKESYKKIENILNPKRLV